MRDVLQRLACMTALTLWTLLGPGCSSGDSAPPPVEHQVTGSAVMATVTGATVAAYAILDTGAIVPTALGTATTAADGSFTIDVGSYVGPVLLVATGGTYEDEATGVSKTISTDMPLLGMTTAISGTATGNLTPLTHWATILAHALAGEPNTDAPLAMANAVKMVEDYFGVADLLTTVPADLTAGAVTPGNEAEHAAAIAGLSQLADGQGYSDPVELADLLAYDGSDGFFDGERRGTPTLPSWDMASQMLRDAIRDFLDNNTRNQSGLGQGDVSVDEAINAHLSSGNASYLWPPRIGAMDVSGGTTAGGTLVTFQGENIDTSSGVDVYFDSAAGTIVSSDANTVEVSTPAAGEGRVDIEIVNLEIGLVTRFENAFQYFAPAAPTIARLCPAYGPTTGGALIEVYGTRFGPTSTVEIDGMTATIVQRRHPDLLVARAPAHAAGTVQVLVRTGAAASNGANFQYRSPDVGQNLTDADYAGSWTLYRLGHDYSGGSSTYAARTSLSFNGTGGISFSETRRTASPSNLPGTQMTTSGSYDYASFPDGTLHIDLNPAADPENREFLRAWTQDEGDVFTGARMERRYVTEIAVGVRNGSGMHNGSLSGKYWLTGLSTQYFDAGGDRYVATLYGYAEFDGAGKGSHTVLVTYGDTGAADYGRGLDSYAFTYTVGSNGDFDLVWEDGTVVHGTVAAAGDFAAATEFDSPGEFEGELAMLLLTRQGDGLAVSSGAGSWYGGEFGMEFDTDHVYYAERFRVLADTRGVSLLDFVYRDTWDSEPEGEAGEHLEAGYSTVAPTGYLVGNSSPPELIGVVGSTRRFLLVAPTWPFGDNGSQGSQTFGLLLRNCAYYSQASLDQRYNTASLGYEYMSPQSPPVADEEATNWVGWMDFTPTNPASLGGSTFLASGTVFAPAGQRKMWKKEPGLGGDTIVVSEPEFNGGYALAGDGRTYVFDTAAKQTFFILGQTAPHGEAAVLRAPAQGNTPTYHTVLTRATSMAPTPSGDYYLCEFNLGVDGSQTTSRVVRGTINLATAGTFSGSLDSYQRWEDGRPDVNSTDPASGTYSIAADGTITVTPTGGTALGGIVTPDGSAIFLVDDNVNSLNVGFGVLLRKNAMGTGVDTAGAFSMLGLEHEFTDTGLYPPAAAAGTGHIDATARTNSAAEIGLVACYRSNEDSFPFVEGGYQPGFGWAVAGDGALTLTVPEIPPQILRGQVAANGRYACAIPGDTVPGGTGSFFFMRR